MGPGRLLAKLSERGWSVTGVDASPEMIELARARVPRGAALMLGSAERLPLGDGEFDAAVAIGVLEYADMEASVAELVRVVRPGARVVLGFRNLAAPVHAWRRSVAHPLGRRLKRLEGAGHGPAARRPKPLSLARIDQLLSERGLRVERVETAGAEVLPDPLDRLFPRLGYRAGRATESRHRLRRLLGSDRLILARRA
jgi:SAM-dependent methyltransferase